MLEKWWLRPGKKTFLTPLIKKVAVGIKGEKLDLIQNISSFVASLEANHNLASYSDKDKRQITADEILSGKRINGCIEAGTLFRALCLARGIPAVFVETLNKRWLYSEPEPKNLKKIEGHVFVNVYVDKKWFTINPGNRNWLHNFSDYGDYIVIGKGRDSADLGFSDMKIFRQWVAKKYKKPYLL